MINKDIKINKSKILIMGFTFKENCPDIRNTKVIDIINELQDFNIQTEVYDPWVDIAKAKKEYDISFIKKPKSKNYDGVILATPHDIFNQISDHDISTYAISKQFVFFDVKSVRDNKLSDIRL